MFFGFESAPVHYFSFLVTTPTPTITPTFTPTSVPVTPIAMEDTPVPLPDHPGLMTALPAAIPSDYKVTSSSFMKDDLGHLFKYAYGQTDQAKDDTGFYTLDIKTGQCRFADYGNDFIFATFFSQWDVSPDGHKSVAGFNLTERDNCSPWVSSGYNSYIKYPSCQLWAGGASMCFGLSPAPNDTGWAGDAVVGLAYDGTNTLYILMQQDAGPLERGGTKHLWVMDQAGKIEKMELANVATSIYRDKYWNVTLGYQDGTTQKIGKPVTALAALQNGKNWGLALLDGAFSALVPPAYADGNGLPPLFQDGANLDFASTPDGRWYVLGLDGLTVYGFDSHYNILDQMSIQEGPGDTFRAVAMAFGLAQV